MSDKNISNTLKIYERYKCTIETMKANSTFILFKYGFTFPNTYDILKWLLQKKEYFGW